MDTPKHARLRTKGVSRYIILVPHRDSLKPVADYRKRLFASGFPGAHSFPLAAPLACVSRRFSESELKELSVNIRKLTERTEGKISGSANGIVHCEKSGLSFFGAHLDIFLHNRLEKSIFPKTAADKIIYVFPTPVLCASLLPGGNAELEQAPPFSFGLNFVANLAVKPLSTGDARYSFEWQMGQQYWLAKFIAKKRK